MKINWDARSFCWTRKGNGHYESRKVWEMVDSFGNIQIGDTLKLLEKKSGTHENITVHGVDTGEEEIIFNHKETLKSQVAKNLAFISGIYSHGDEKYFKVKFAYLKNVYYLYRVINQKHKS